MRVLWVLMVVFCVVQMVTSAAAQNIPSYNSIAEPYLLLLREKEVLDQLRLTNKQSEALEAINRKADGPLLKMRTRPAAEQQTQTNQLIAQTRTQVNELLSAKQRRRLGEIRLQVRGVKGVLLPGVAERLDLSRSQTRQIEKVLEETQEKLAALRVRIKDGESQDLINQQAIALRRREQMEILDQLERDQRNDFGRLLGRPINYSKMQRVSFWAPKIEGASDWINSEPLSLEQLRGKVVAIHFWAFG